MTEKQKKICEKYSKRQPDGLVRCNVCPLVIDRRNLMCRANSEYNRKTKTWEPNYHKEDAENDQD